MFSFSYCRVAYKLSEAYRDISAFMKLTDSIMEFILYWNNDGCREAQDIFDAVLRRKIYKYYGYVAQPPEVDISRFGNSL